MPKKIYVREIKGKTSDGEELITVTTYDSKPSDVTYLIFVSK